jgi:hypothetical protein
VSQGLASSVDVAIPDGVVVNQVSGSLVADWDFKPGSLKVNFLEPVTAQTSFTVAAEARTPRDGTVGVRRHDHGHGSELAGFSTARRSLSYDQRARRIDFRTELGGVHESVAVTAETTANVQVNRQAQSRSGERTQDAVTQVAPSQNVINLQRRVAGVLPVRVDVPRAGTQYRFVRPLVLEEETTVSFRYKTR